MSRLSWQLEDHFRFLAEQERGAMVRTAFRGLSSIFAFVGDLLHACSRGFRPL